MKPTIHFGNDTDLATQQMLIYLIERKDKYTKVKNKHKLTLYITCIYTLGYLYFTYHTLLLGHHLSLFDTFLQTINEIRFLLLLIIAIVLFAYSNMLFKKKEKYKKEYEDLRCEIIDRSKDLWKGDAWKNRHQLFGIFKEQYDINLYHESD